MSQWKLALYIILTSVLTISTAWFLTKPDYESAIAILVAITPLGTLLFQNKAKDFQKLRSWIAQRKRRVSLVAVFLLFMITNSLFPAKENEQLSKTPTGTPSLVLSPTPTPTSANIASLSDYYLDKKLDLAILLSIEDYRRESTIEAKINLFNTVQESRGVLKFFREHDFAVRDIEFNPDGSLFASSSCYKVDDRNHCIQGEILLWEVSDKDVKVISRIVAHHDLINTIVFSTDGKSLISGSCGKKDDLGKCSQGEIIVWDVSNLKNPIQVGNPVNVHTDFVRDLIVVPGTNIFLSSGCGQKSTAGDCIEGQVLSWVVSINGAKQWDISISSHVGDIKSMAINNSGNVLATGSADNFISIWNISDLNSYPQLLTEFKSEFKGVPNLSFSSDGKTLFSANSDNTIKYWNVLDDNSISITQSFYTGENSVFYDSINKLLISGGNDREVKVWDLSDKDHPKLAGDPYTAHNSEVNVVKSTPNGGIWISGARDGVIIVWDFLNQDIQSLPGYPLYGHNSDVVGLSISSDEKIMASGSCGKRGQQSACILGEIIIWDLTNPMMAKPIGQKIFGHKGHIYSLAFSSNGLILASGGGDGNIIFWDISNPELPKQIGFPLIAHRRIVQSLAFTPDGTILASGGDDGKLILWDVSNPQTPKVLNSFFTGEKRVYDIEFVSNNYGFIAADGLQKLMLSDVYVINKVNDSEKNVRSVAVDHNLAIVAAAGRDGNVYLWNMTNFDSLVKNDRPLAGQNETILDVAFGEKYYILASGGSDANIVVWYLTAPGLPVQTKPIASFLLKGHAQNVLRLKFISDDNFLISSGGDEKIVVWVLDPTFWIKSACRIVTRNFTLDEWKRYFPEDPYQDTC